MKHLSIKCASLLYKTKSTNFLEIDPELCFDILKKT